MAPAAGIPPKSILDDLHKFWFDGLADPGQFIAPPLAKMGAWFSQSDEIDAECRNRFGGVLQGIREHRPDAHGLIEALEPMSPKQWVALVILLDQIPRNVYRGTESAIVFREFDPLGLAVSTEAVTRRVDKGEFMRLRVAERMFLYLPMEHCEDILQQNRSMEEFSGVQNLVEQLRDAGQDAPTHQLARDLDQDQVKLLVSSADATLTVANSLVRYAEKHQEQIKSFGRFPHRNKALGRENTAEEQKYLDENGNVFSK